MKGLAKELFNFIQAIKGAIGKVVFSEVIPDSLNRIKLWAIRWQRQQTDGVWHPQITGAMPTGAIQKHEAEISREHMRSMR
jgi:hypothetical protein